MKITIEKVIALVVIVVGICILKWYIVLTFFVGTASGLIGAKIAIKSTLPVISRQQQKQQHIAAAQYGFIILTLWSVFAFTIDHQGLSVTLVVIGIAGAVFMGRYAYIERTCAPSPNVK